MIRLSFSALLALVLACGCGGKVVVDGDPGGDGGTGTPCDQACARAADACGQDLATCTSVCKQNLIDDVNNGCAELYGTLVTCVATAADDMVCGPGKDVPASCQGLYDEWNACTP